MTGSLGSKEPGRSEAGGTFCLAGIESERWKMLKNAVRLQGDSGCHVEFRLYPEGNGEPSAALGEGRLRSCSCLIKITVVAT